MTKNKPTPALALAQIATLYFALLMSSVSAQESEKLSVAQKLVEQARLHQLAALGMRVSVAHAVAQNKATQTMSACVSAVDSGVFLLPVASVYADKLAADDLKAALGFISSSAGQKYVAFTFRGTEEAIGISTATAPVSVTIDEKNAIERFIASPVGKQMSGVQSPLALASQREIAQIVDSIVGRCKLTSTQSGTRTIADERTYSANLSAIIRSNSVFNGNPDRIPGNPTVHFRIEQLPTGEIYSLAMIESSGIPEFDAAVARAIAKSSPLPKRRDGTVASVIVVDVQMKNTQQAK